jgi:hypothetical protein
MQTQNTKTAIDFTGQNIYVGIDTNPWFVLRTIFHHIHFRENTKKKT